MQKYEFDYELEGLVSRIVLADLNEDAVDRAKAEEELADLLADGPMLKEICVGRAEYGADGSGVLRIKGFDTINFSNATWSVGLNGAEADGLNIDRNRTAPRAPRVEKAVMDALCGVKGPATDLIIDAMRRDVETAAGIIECGIADRGLKSFFPVLEVDAREQGVIELVTGGAAKASACLDNLRGMFGPLPFISWRNKLEKDKAGAAERAVLKLHGLICFAIERNYSISTLEAFLEILESKRLELYAA